MKYFLNLLILIFVIRLSVMAENAPAIHAGIILNAPLSPAVTSVPVTVSGFGDIGSFYLTLDYYSSVLTYSGFTPNTAFPGMNVTVSTPGRLVISWPQSGMGITLPDDAVLLTLNFTYTWNGVYTTLDWYDNGTSCRFSKYAGGTYQNLTDTPYSSFYFSGAVTNKPAPVTLAPVITNASPGAVAVPVRVAGCSNINSVDLSLLYASNVLTYTGFVKNPLVPGSMSVGNNPYAANVKKITIAYFGATFSLPDTSTLLTLYFTYASTAGNASYTTLTWYDNGPSCLYSDASYNVLYDDWTTYFYHNGLVASQYAPHCSLPHMANAAPGNPVTIPVDVSGFSNVRSLSLSFEYDPAAMTYNSFTADPAFGGTLTVSDLISGSKRKVSINWAGTSSLTLPDGTSLVNLNFSYISGSSALAWITVDATSCRFNDAAGNAYYDLPKSSFYFDGLLTSQEAPFTICPNVTPVAGQMALIPVLVYQFKNTGHFTLTLDYDPGVLAYQSATLVPAIGGSFSASTAGPGRISVQWYGPATTLPDSSVLLNLSFNYAGGETALAWHDDGSSCKYAVSSSGTPWYDSPAALYYINGYAGPNPLGADFTASEVLMQVNDIVAMSSVVAGSPTSYSWSISPSTFKFINGTSANSANPQIRISSNGEFTVALRIYRGTAAAARVRTGYLHAGTAGLWTGLSSTDWMTGSNWHNYLVPGATEEVTIPSSAPNWPHFSGNLIIGTHCSNLNLEEGSVLIIEGE